MKWVLILSFLPFIATGQKFDYSLKRVAHSAAIQFGGGFFNGVGQTLSFSYNGSVFPQGYNEKFLWGNRQYWDAQISWKNKYENWPIDRSERFPLSTSALVWATDGWHLMNTLERTAHRATIITYIQPQGPGKGWKKLADVALMTISYSAGVVVGRNITKR